MTLRPFWLLVGQPLFALHAAPTAPPLALAPKPGLATPPAATRPSASPTKPLPRPAVHHRQPARRPVLRAERHVIDANRAATQEPAAQGFINAVQVYPFAESVIYHVYTAPERVTDIALQPGETLGAVAAGDTVRWVVGDTTSGSGADKRTHVLVKPFAAGQSTNLVITTDRRGYHLQLTSTASAAMAAVSWTYPQDALIALKHVADVAQAAAPVAIGLALDHLHFGYDIGGDQPAWRPLRAFDDGRQTFIEFPASIAVGEAPPLFVIDGKGAAQLVNYRQQGHFYVVDRLFDAAELRLGLKHQDIVRISRQAEAGQRRQPS